MKSLSYLVAFFLTLSGFAQTDEYASSGKINDLVIGSHATNIGSSFFFKNPAREVDGTVYLFDNWNNMAYIYTSDNQRFQVLNINLNVDRQVFESKFSSDSIFSFTFNNINKFIINNRVYKNYFYDNDNRVYQVLYENDKFSILKGFKVDKIEGSSNPMLNRSRDKLVRKESYFIKTENSIKTFHLQEGSILGLFDIDKTKKKAIKKYAKDNNLSFKEENDIDKIISFALEN